MAYATTAEVKQRIGKQGDDRDTSIAALIEAAEDAINRYCNRPDGFVALAGGAETSREFYGSGLPYQYVDEFVGVTLVEVKDSPSSSYTSWAASDWVAFAGDPSRPSFSPLTRSRPYHALMCSASGDYSVFTAGNYWRRGGFKPTVEVLHTAVPTVRVTARWGYAAAVPAAVREATIVQVARWMKRSESGWADTLANRDFGTVQYLRDIDPAVSALLVRARMVKPAIGNW